MTRPQVQPAPDYTNAFLAMVYLIGVMGLVVIWGVWGYSVALASCWLAHRAMTWRSGRTVP